MDENSLTLPGRTDRSSASRLRFFGTGVAVGLVIAISMLGAISMMYP